MKHFDGLPPYRRLELATFWQRLCSESEEYWKSRRGQRELRNMLIEEADPAVMAALTADQILSQSKLMASAIAQNLPHYRSEPVAAMQGTPTVDTERFEVQPDGINALSALKAFVEVLQEAWAAARNPQQRRVSHAASKKGFIRFHAPDKRIYGTLRFLPSGDAEVTAFAVDPSLEQSVVTILVKPGEPPALILKRQEDGSLFGRVIISQSDLPMETPNITFALQVHRTQDRP